MMHNMMIIHMPYYGGNHDNDNDDNDENYDDCKNNDDDLDLYDTDN